jgi:hypothetical protein
MNRIRHLFGGEPPEQEILFILFMLSKRFFPGARPRTIWVAPGRTHTNPVAPSKPEYGTEANEENKVEFSGPDLKPSQITFVAFATFCSNPRGLADCCADFTHLRADQRRSVKPVAPGRTQSNQSQITGPLALLCGFPGKGRMSLCKSLISRYLSIFPMCLNSPSPHGEGESSPTTWKNQSAAAYFSVALVNSLSRGTGLG